MFYYGFVIENNSWNGYSFYLSLNSAEPLSNQKTNMLGFETIDYLKNFIFFEIYADHQHKNNKLMSYVRLIVYKGDLNVLTPYLTPAVVNAQTCPHLRRKFSCPPISVENEKATLAEVMKYAKTALAKYPDSYEGDVKILAENKKLTFNERNAIVLRCGEKKVM